MKSFEYLILPFIFLITWMSFECFSSKLLIAITTSYLYPRAGVLKMILKFKYSLKLSPAILAPTAFIAILFTMIIKFLMAHLFGS